MNVKRKNNRTVTIPNRPRRWHRIRGNVVVTNKHRYNYGNFRNLVHPLPSDLGRTIKQINKNEPNIRFYMLR